MTTHTTPAIETRDLTKTFGIESGATIAALDRVTLTIEPGTVVALTGASGSGKSTLLHLIGAIERPDSGTITVAGTTLSGLTRTQLAAYRRTIGFVFQRYNLLPALTALDNVLAPVIPYRTDYDKPTRARELLTAVGLQGREHDLPTKMSGGQQQRIAIARALIENPTSSSPTNPPATSTRSSATRSSPSCSRCAKPAA